MDSLKLNPVQKAAFSLIQQDLRYIYTVIKNINPKASNYIPSMLPYLGVVIDGAEDWLMNEIGGRYINLFHATTDFQVNNELQFGVQDYGGFIKSPVGNVYSDKFVLMSILCQINFLLYGIEKWINNEIPTKLRFGYLLYYSLISVIEQINQKLGIALKINSKWKSDRFRNSMAHYKLGIVLKESNLIISDAMFGLTEKIFGEDYYTIKKSIYKELEKLAKQIGAYLDLPQRMVYLQ